jgi:6-pyruvoyltetrahydropterin/6-carboxytetrahydropterin synthase
MFNFVALWLKILIKFLLYLSVFICLFISGEKTHVVFPAVPPRITPLMHVRLTKSFHFEAAHDLPTFPPNHKCRRLHGHSFRFDVIVDGLVDPAKGYLIDYGDIKTAAEPIVKKLDHFYLNQIEGLSNPTSETIAKWIFDRLKPALPMLTAINVHETCTSSCEYRGE